MCCSGGMAYGFGAMWFWMLIGWASVQAKNLSEVGYFFMLAQFSYLFPAALGPFDIWDSQLF